MSGNHKNNHCFSYDCSVLLTTYLELFISAGFVAMYFGERIWAVGPIKPVPGVKFPLV